MRSPLSRLDRYLLAQLGGTLGSVFGIVISLMLFEHLPRLFDIVRLSGRKTPIVIESIISLLPEYAAIGLLFGLYLAIALTVRRLSLRGELDVIEATGVAPRRWMRMPGLAALFVACLLAWTQGWLMPAGERNLAKLSRQIENGSFGYALESRDFVDLGKGVIVKFERVDSRTGDLIGVFIRTGETTFTASRGRLGFDFRGGVLIDLADGRSVDGSNGQSLSFAHFRFDSGGPNGRGAKPQSGAERRKSIALSDLLLSANSGDRAAAWSRLMWPAIALLIPLLAVVLGKPRRRGSNSLGLLAGVVLLVLFIRLAGLVASAGSEHPALLALSVFAGWAAVARLLARGERRWGPGYIDAWLLAIAGRLRRRRAAGKVFPQSTEDQNLSRRQRVQTAGAL